ncbi:hypothetical protein [Rhodococcus sp. NPDC060084]|uniref:hypothetical protein n=1 Tax=Rhodococcus sp. NPDC060084 TaxID=3347053 RepID=UPI003662D9C7
MSFRLPHLANQLQIEQWAEKYDARAVLPQLVRKLISDTVPGIPRLRMEGNEHVDFGGYDGEVTSLVQTPFVPKGDSVWEFGVSGDPKGKADDDYKKRTYEDSLGVDKASTTFVFITPRRWANGEKWAKEKKNENQWKNVLVLTAADIFAALENSPRTHVWFSEEIGLMANSVMTLSRWWNGFSGGTRGLLTSELLVAGRERQKDELLQRITSVDTSHIWLRAETVDDVLAFSVASIHTLDAEAQQSILDRALVVFEPGALRYFGDTEGLLILLPFDDSLVRQADLIHGHHIILHTTNDTFGSIPLINVPIVKAKKLLEDAGVGQDDAGKWAKAINKSLPLFKSLITGTTASAVAAAPAGFEASDIARRLWLLGSWNFDIAGDVDVIEKLTGQSLDAVRQELSKWSVGAAPIFTNVGNAWKVFDVTASFASVTSQVNTDDLHRLVVTMQDVLGSVNPALDLPRDQRWRAGIEGKRPQHSSDLRRGLARSLAALRAYGADVESLRAGQSLGAWAQMVVRAVLERANADPTGRQWESLFDVLSLLAEAAPDYFTEALDQALATDGALHGRVFTSDAGDMMSPTSPHVHLLWALETIAWSSDFFGAAVTTIFNLAAQDPGIKNGNRPIHSLTNIFRPWHPQTAASLKSRNRVLARLVRKDAEKSWPLLYSLLPDSHAFALEGSGPEFHDWKIAAQAKTTMADYVSAVSEIVNLCVQLAGEKPIRFVELVDSLNELPSNLREVILSAVEAAADADLGDAAPEALWKSLTGFTRRHREYSEAEWALDESVLSRIDEVAAKFEPASRADRVEWLFEHTPDLVDVHLTDDYDAYRAELTRRQLAAVESVYDESGLEGIAALARSVQTPWAVGYGAASSDKIDFNLLTFSEMLIDQNRSIRIFAESVIETRLRRDTGAVISLAQKCKDNALIAARVLRTASNPPLAWEAAEAMGQEVEALYWSEFVIEGRGQYEYVNETASELGKHGRYALALDLLALYSRNKNIALDADLIVELLSKLLDADNDPDIDRLSSYDFGALLSHVRERATLSLEELGMLEWRLLRALDEDPANTLAIERLLASSPKFFVEIVSLLYRRSDGKEDAGPGATRATEAQAGNAWHLFQRWHLIPGTDVETGEINEVELRTWVSTARELLRDAGRLHSGEAQIGTVLAYSKTDADGTWPSLPVRNFLEDESSEVIDRHFMISINNQRGVTTRGLDEGGDQERILAERYYALASTVTDEWPRTARLLRRIAESYKHEANREDENAKRFQEGFDQ